MSHYLDAFVLLASIRSEYQFYRILAFTPRLRLVSLRHVTHINTHLNKLEDKIYLHFQKQN